MRERALLASTLSLLLFFGAAVVSLAHTAALDYDAAYNASVAKNIAIGVGYASSYHELVPYDPTMTLGPAVVLPLAVWLRIFGTGLEAPLVFQALQSLALLLLLLAVAWTAAPENRGKRVLLLLGAIVAYAAISDSSRYWFMPYGDVQTALLLVAGALLWVDERPRRQLIGAALLGTTLLVKLFSIFGLAAILLCSWKRPRAPAPHRRKLLLALVAPSLLWWIWIAIRIGSEMPYYLQSSLTFLAQAGSGLTHLGDVARLFVPRLLPRLGVLIDYLGGAWMAPIFAALLILGRVGARDASPSLRRAATALLWSGPLLLAWWLVFSSQGFPRHLYIARYCVVCAMALDLSALTGRARLAGYAMGAALLIAGVIALPLVDRRGQRARLEAVAQFLVEREKDPRTMLLGNGWWANRGLEYAMPGALHFRDVRRLDAADAQGRTLYLVRQNRLWNHEHDPQVDAWTRECDEHIVYRLDDYTVSQCSTLPKLPVDLLAHHW
jgi:hypothetical protein